MATDPVPDWRGHFSERIVRELFSNLERERARISSLFSSGILSALLPMQPMLGARPGLGQDETGLVQRPSVGSLFQSDLGKRFDK